MRKRSSYRDAVWASLFWKKNQMEKITRDFGTTNRNGKAVHRLSRVRNQDSSFSKNETSAKSAFSGFP